MKAISKKARPYVMECDRAEPRDKQTIFWIKPKTHKEANRMTKRYGGTVKEDTKGFKEYNETKLNNADQEEWLDTIEKIENFAFDEDYYARYPQMKERANAEGYIAKIDDDNTKLDVLEVLLADNLNEIWKAAQDISKLREGEKND